MQQECVITTPQKIKSFQGSYTVPCFLFYHVPLTPRELPLGNCFNFGPKYIYVFNLFESLFSNQISPLYALSVLWFAS